MLLDGGQLILGPGASALGLREALRRLGPAAWAEPLRMDAAGFAEALARVYRQEEDAEGGAAGAGDATVLFDLEDTAATARQRDLLDDPGDAPVIPAGQPPVAARGAERRLRPAFRTA